MLYSNMAMKIRIFKIFEKKVEKLYPVVCIEQG